MKNELAHSSPSAVMLSVIRKLGSACLLILCVVHAAYGEWLPCPNDPENPKAKMFPLKCDVSQVYSSCKYGGNCRVRDCKTIEKMYIYAGDLFLACSSSRMNFFNSLDYPLPTLISPDGSSHTAIAGRYSTPCTDNVLQTLDPKMRSELTIYNYLYFNCTTSYCAKNHRMKAGDPVCFSLWEEAPQIILSDVYKGKFCGPYATVAEGCNPLPICRGDPFLLSKGQDSMPLVRIDKHDTLQIVCETLCVPGKNNNHGKKCRKIPPPGVDPKYSFSVGFEVPWCERAESLQRNTEPMCMKRPICISGKAPTDPKENPFGSTICEPPLDECTKEEIGKYYCRDITPIEAPAAASLCERYSVDVTDLANRNCTPVPLCIDIFSTNRMEDPHKCEELCSIEDNTGHDCRRIPSIGADPFNVAGRIRAATPNQKIADFFKELNDVRSAAGNLKEVQSQRNFLGIPWCEDNITVVIGMNPKFCNRRPLCSKVWNSTVATDNPYYASESDCVEDLSNCNEEEKKKYICSDVVEKPWCNLYEKDIRKLSGKDACQPRLLCEDVQLKKIKRRPGVYLLKFYDIECERLCPKGAVQLKPETEEMLRAPNTTLPPKQDLSCRPLPSLGSDYFNVARFDSSRLRNFCSKEDSLLLNPPLTCNPYPLCDEDGKAPSDTQLNPFFALGTDCVTPKDCTNEEKPKYHCADSSSLAWLYWVLAIFLILLVILLAYIVYKKFIAPRTKSSSQRSEAEQENA